MSFAYCCEEDIRIRRHTNKRGIEQNTNQSTAQGWNNRTLAVHERVDCRFVVLPGSRSTITEITEYTYFSPLKPRREFEYKSEENTVPVDLIIEPILFL